MEILKANSRKKVKLALFTFVLFLLIIASFSSFVLNNISINDASLGPQVNQFSVQNNSTNVSQIDLYLNGIKNGNAPFNYTLTNYTAKSQYVSPNHVPNYIRLYINGTPVAGPTKNSVSYISNNLKPGFYKITASSNTSEVRYTQTPKHDPPAGVIAYAQVNITNSQTSGVSGPFQQLVNLSLTNYRGYINDTGTNSFQNVEFFNSTNGMVLKSWLENYSFSNNWALYWIKLPNGMPASTTTQDVAVGFASNATNLFSTNTTGEAPYLSPTYSEYDNGNNTFLLYFNGNTSISDFSVLTGDTLAQATSVSYGAKTVNAIEITESTANEYAHWSYIGQSLAAQAVIVEANFEWIKKSNTGEVGLSNSSAVGKGFNAISDVEAGTSLQSPRSYAAGVATAGTNSGTSALNTWYWATLNWPGPAATSFSVITTTVPEYETAAVPTSLAKNPLSAATTLYIAPYSQHTGTSADVVDYNLLRARAYPPNGVMPSITQGSLKTTTTPPAVKLYLQSLAVDTNATGGNAITYGTTSTFTANISSGFVELWTNVTGTLAQTEPLTHLTVTYSKSYLAAGYYQIIAGSNTSGIANMTLYEKINKATPTLSMTDTPGNFTYNGTKDNTSAAITTVNDQLAATLYIGGASKGSSTTRVSYLNATAGTYHGVFNTSGGQNYTSASVQTTSIISRATTVLSLTGYIGAGTSAANFTYNGTVEKFTGSVVSPASGVAGKLYVNGVTKTSPYSNATAGAYVAVFNASGDVNYSSASATIAREISQAALTQTLTVFPSDKFTYTGSPPVIQDALSGTQVSGQSGLSFVLDNNSVSTGSTFSASLSVAKYNFSALSDKYAGVHYKNNYTYSGTSGGNQNYTVTTSGITQVNITKATPTLSMTDTPGNFTYNGTKDNTSAAITTVNDQLAATLYIGGASKGSSTTRVSYLNATAGTYHGVFNTSGNQNYSSTRYKLARAISKATPNMTLTVPANFTYNGSSGIATANLFSLNNQLSASWNLNGPEIAEVPLFYLLIKIQNSLNQSTPASFQEELIFNSSAYKRYEAPNLDNIEFTYPNGTVVPSWLEINDSYNSSGTLYWLKIGSIPAGNFSMVHMVFFNKSENVLNNVTTGEAPGLSPRYAEYDDGGYVFDFYSDLKGSTLNMSKWTVEANGGTYNVSSGLVTSSSLNDYTYILSKEAFSYPTIFEWYVAPSTTGAPFANSIQFGYSVELATNELYVGTIDRLYLDYAINSTTHILSPSTVVTNNIKNNLYGISANGTKVMAYFDYRPVITESDPYLPSNIPFSAILNYESGLTSPKIYWIRVRTYPLGGG